MPYPTSPSDGDFHTEDGTRRRYVAASDTWIVDPEPGIYTVSGGVLVERPDARVILVPTGETTPATVVGDVVITE